MRCLPPIRSKIEVENFRREEASLKNLLRPSTPMDKKIAKAVLIESCLPDNVRCLAICELMRARSDVYMRRTVHWRTVQYDQYQLDLKIWYTHGGRGQRERSNAIFSTSPYLWY